MLDLETVSLDDLSKSVVAMETSVLLSSAKTLVQRERELNARLIVLLRELEERGAHLELGYSSLFDLLIKYFGMSEGSASRRVAGVRLLAEVPEVRDKIEGGALTLTNLAAAQRFFQCEKKNEHPLEVQDKKQILESLVGKSSREVEKELLQRSSSPLELHVPDQVKVKSETHVEIRFLAPQELVDLLEQAKGLLAHRLGPQASLAEVVQVLAEIGIQSVKKKRFGVGVQTKGKLTEKAEKGTEVVKAVKELKKE